MLLAIYLNDHLAAATGAVELSRRAAGSNRGASCGAFLARLGTEIAADRETLREIMRALEVRVDRLKVLGGWSAEKLGRLKFNGRLVGYSPLSRVVELEMLALGISGKLELWRALEQLSRDNPVLANFDLPRLIGRAQQQLEEVEPHRLRAVADAFA
jgi:hypothetical protein